MQFRVRLGRVVPSVIVGVLLALAATSANAQAPVPGGPAVGEMAPDFVLPGATRYGLLREPVSLASLRGNTVVLAFFFKARTKG